MEALPIELNRYIASYLPNPTHFLLTCKTFYRCFSSEEVSLLPHNIIRILCLEKQRKFLRVHMAIRYYVDTMPYFPTDENPVSIIAKRLRYMHSRWERERRYIQDLNEAQRRYGTDT